MNWIITGAGNGLSPVRHQAITWTNDGLCSLNPWEQISVKFEIVIHSGKCIWKCRLPNWRPFCPGRDELMYMNFSVHSVVCWEYCSAPNLLMTKHLWVIYLKRKLTRHVWKMKSIASELFKCLNTYISSSTIDACHLFPVHHGRVGQSEFYFLQLNLSSRLYSLKSGHYFGDWHDTMGNGLGLLELCTRWHGAF